MINKKSVKMVPLTPELAASFHAMLPMPGERALKQSRLDFLSALVRKGQFSGVDWHEGIDLSTGKVYRADGQHSSEMLFKLPPDKFPQGLSATVTTWTMSSVAEDGLTLFEQFNHPASVRDTADVMGYNTAAWPELDAIPRKTLVKIANGIGGFIKAVNEEEDRAYLKARKKNPDTPAPIALQTLTARGLGNYYASEEFRRFALWLFSLSIKSGVKNAFMLNQRGIISAILADWKRSTPFAEKFWHDVLTESNPDPDAFSRELASNLREMRADAHRHTQSDYFRAATKAAKKAAAVEAVATPPPPPATTWRETAAQPVEAVA